MIRECLMDAADASQVLSDSAFNRKVRSYLSRLRGYHIGADGHLMEWYYDWADEDPQHRHQSHLFGVYPGHQISGGEYADAALKSLEIKGFETTGWSCGWRINLYARLRDADNAYRMYRRLLRYISPDNYRGPDARRGGGTYPNLLDAHSPFQIDGNFGGCAGVMEMLLRSEDAASAPVPARPLTWSGRTAKSRNLKSNDWQETHSLLITSAGFSTIARWMLPNTVRPMTSSIQMNTDR